MFYVDNCSPLFFIYYMGYEIRQTCSEEDRIECNRLLTPKMSTIDRVCHKIFLRALYCSQLKYEIEIHENEYHCAITSVPIGPIFRRKNLAKGSEANGIASVLWF